MASLTSAARALTRAVPRSSPGLARCLSTTAVRPDATSSYESPFKGERTTTNIPDFSKYASKAAPQKNLVYQYFMVGTFGAITAMGAKATIQGKPHGKHGIILPSMRANWLQRTRWGPPRDASPRQQAIPRELG